MSLEEFLELPDKPKSEWVDGVALLMAPAKQQHGSIQWRVCAVLDRDLYGVEVFSEAGLRTDASCRVPDVMVLDATDFEPDAEYSDKVPLIAVEILSPHTWRNDLIDKLAEYAAHGVRQYWTIDPEGGSVTVRENRAGAWHVTATLDATTPEAHIPVGNHGTVTLRKEEIFGG
jgi:Uma2 family endonuclease